MTREEFEKWVRDLEEFSRKEPSRYQLRVGLLTAVGYSMVWLLLAGILLVGLVLLVLINGSPLASGAGIVALIVLGLPLLGSLLLIGQALAVRIPEPSGMVLDRARAATLFHAVDALGSTLGAPKVHRILLDSGFSAAVVQSPRLGVFGWYRNTLIVGLPLMQTLSPQQFGAVIAHELAHLSGRHGRFGAWVHRVKQTWGRLVDSFQTHRKTGLGLLYRFLRWYMPLFNAYTFVLRRQNEYHADRLSAELAGTKNAAEALITTHIAESYLQEYFWPSVDKLAEEAPAPPPGLFAVMARTLPKVTAAPDAPRWLRRAMLVETDFNDTHPCLADRLGALGYLAKAQSAMEVAWRTQAPAVPERTAAQHYFGRSLEELTTQLENDWRDAVYPVWRQQFAAMKEGRRRLHHLNRKAECGELTDQESLDQCLLTKRLSGTKHAIPIAQHLVLLNPNHPGLHFLLGQFLLEEKDPRGIAHLEKAMEIDLSSRYAGCELIFAYLKSVGRLQEADVYLHRAEQHYAAMRGAERERDGLNASDKFELHTLTGDWVYYLRERLEEVEEFEEAFLVQKVIGHFRQTPMYVLAVSLARAPWWQRWYREDALDLLLGKIRQFPHHLLVIPLDKCPKGVESAIRGIKGARIHPRPRT